MKQVALVILGIALLSGCSSAVVSPGTEQDIPSIVKAVACETSHWLWDQCKVRISADRANAEVLPLRGADLHLNLNKFVEGSTCPSCLSIGAVHPQPDGTIKLDVKLRHPFPLSPEYTGFDVRGIVVFKATDYWHSPTTVGETTHTPFLMVEMLHYYSDPLKGGAALIDPDGYTFYLNPLLIYEDRPDIWNYSKGKKAYGEPDCTINPYVLFSDGSPRRMFKTSDQMTRTYHIKPPDGGGPFEFGYVVSACWAMPDNMPVTNPETDFPVIANCEDPYEISVVQLQPFDYDVGNQPLFKVRVKHRLGEWTYAATMIVPELSTCEDYNNEVYVIVFKSCFDAPEDIQYIDDETDEFVMRFLQAYWDNIGDGLVPGTHLGFLEVVACGKKPWGDGYYSQLNTPFGVNPVKVEVVID